MIRIGKGGEISLVDLALDPTRHSAVEAQGQLALEGGRAIWSPPPGGGSLSLTAKISHRRESGEYDACMTADWAIFRGDNLVPGARVRAARGATSRAHLRFVMPAGWTNVDTGWPRAKDGSFQIDNPARGFDRPVGWMIAGKVGTRRDMIGSSEVSVAAPVGSPMRRMDVLTFLNVVWPAAAEAFGRMPPKLLVVGHGPPMWRGGLSASNSLFLHAERPLVSENGTSALVHELVHVVTRIKGAPGDDWIAEGLAEYYGFELLHRAGAMSDTRHRKVRAWMERWGRDVKSLRVARSKGRITARAAVLLQDLDREIRTMAEGEATLDDVVRRLMEIHAVSLKDLRRAAEEVAGGRLKTLETPLLW
jgi:hypothetical protein